MIENIKMKPTLLTFFFFFIFCNCLKAQTTITGVVTDSINNPIPFASVYLSNTTIGAVSDHKGMYSLTFSQDGVFDLIASCIGYMSSSEKIHAEGKNQIINIKLRENSILINEVTFKTKDRNRIRNYSQFIKLFIGESLNAQSCKIINIDDVRLYKDAYGNIAKGFSIKPLRIENKALGYVITYNLVDFSYNQKTKILKYTGSQFFQPMKGSEKKVESWKQNRLLAYYGSSMHLFRSLISDSLKRNNFKIYQCKKNTNKDDYSIVIPLQERSLRQPSDKNISSFYYNQPVLISYTEDHSIASSALFGFQPQEFKSIIIFNKHLKVHKDGRLDNPYAITFEGKMSNERVSDMLPFDFWPYERDEYVSESNDFESLISKYLTFQQNLRSKDQIFVHTDRNKYFAGDTIYFQAYVRNRFNGEFKSSSTYMYAMLINDQKEIVDSSRFRIDGSTSSGWLSIPTNAKFGKYQIVAYTSMMQNFDPKDAFRLDLNVDVFDDNQEKVELTFNKENYRTNDTIVATVKIIDAKGNPIKLQEYRINVMLNLVSIYNSDNHTDINGESIIRFTLPDSISNQPELQIIINKNKNISLITKSFNIPFDNHYIDLRLLTEGGALVPDIEQRIGFNATDRRGESVEIEGVLKTANGKKVCNIKSGIYGPGSFVCRPDRGMYVELTNEHYRDKKWLLPEFSISNLCLSVKPINSRTFLVEIQSNGYFGDSVFVSGSMNSTEIFSQGYTLFKKQRIEVETDQLPSGIAQITLFDRKMRPIAERLYYVNADKHIQFNIQPNSQVYNSGKETELIISATDGLGNPLEGIFSMSVIDSTSGHQSDIFTPGIEYSMNYNPYLLANLPPQVLVKGFENIKEEDRDLMLLIYGWKRYNWEFAKVKSSNLSKIINYDIMTMNLQSTKSSRTVSKLDLFSFEGLSTIHLQNNKNNEILLPFDSLPSATRSIMLIPNKKDRKKLKGVALSIPINQQYYKSTNLFINRPTIPSSVYSFQTSKSDNNISLSDKSFEIKEILIKGRRKSEIKYHDQYEEIYKDANCKSLTSEPLHNSTNLAVALYKITLPDIINNKVYIRPKTSFIGPRVPVLFVLDGLPLYNTDDAWGIVNRILPSDILSITVVKGPQGWTRYGEPAKGGLIFINTISYDPKYVKQKSDLNSINLKNNLLLPVNIFRSNIEFYNPTKLEVDLDPNFQSSPTIFWKSDVYFNGNEPIKIKFPNLVNAKCSGKVLITINGVSTNNMIGTGRASYTVLVKK